MTLYTCKVTSETLSTNYPTFSVQKNSYPNEGLLKKHIRDAATWIAGLHIHCWHQIKDLIEVFPNQPYHGEVATLTRRRPQFKCCKCHKIKVTFYLIGDY